MPIDRWLRGLALFGVLLCFGVVVLGAYVRLTDAGLGCPDWPGCYGHVSPLGAEDSPGSQAQFPGRPLQAGKAWHEMSHRYAAGTLAGVITVIAALAIAARKPKAVGAGFALLLFATVIVQAILGMLTVTWLLKPLIVTLHLIFGMTTLGLLWWLWLRLQQRPRGAVQLHIVPEHGATRWASAASAARIAYWLAIVGVVAAGGPILPRWLDQRQLCRRCVPRLSDLSGRVVAARRLPPCVRAVARTLDQL